MIKSIVGKFEEGISAEDFISRNSKLDTSDLTKIVSKVIAYADAGIDVEEMTDEQENTLLKDLQGFLDEFGMILDRPSRIEKPKEKKESPEKEKAKEEALPADSSAPPPLVDALERQLDAEIYSASNVIKEELKDVTSAEKRQILKNLLRYVDAFAPDNRIIGTDAKLKEIVVRLNMIANKVAHDRYKEFTVDKLNKEFEIWRKRGFNFKQMPDFKLSEEEFERPGHLAEVEDLADTLEKQGRVLSQLHATYVALNKGDTSVTKLAGALEKISSHVVRVAAAMISINQSNKILGITQNDMMHFESIENTMSELIDKLEEGTVSFESAKALAQDPHFITSIVEAYPAVGAALDYLNGMMKKASPVINKVIKTGDGWLLG
jgi:hypothetical protein